MPRLLPVFLSALALAFVLMPLTHASAAEKEFSDAGVKWKLPDGWSFSPVSGAEKGAGFFAKVECSSASVEVWAYAKATDGLDLAQRAAELKQAGAEGMGSVQKTKVLDTTLSGVKGKVVVQRIQADGGTPGHFRKYVMVSDGKFYQLLMRCWHDAHTSVGDEINAVRQGFRLLKGAGGEDAKETLTEVDAAADKGDAEDGAKEGGSASDEEDDGWPKNGPKKEGRKVSMLNHNFSWDLPEASKFEWTRATSNVKNKTGNFMSAMARVKRKKKEYEKNTPDNNVAQMDVILLNTNPGFKPVNWIKQGHAKDYVVKQLGALTEVAGSTNKDSVKFGNHRASFVKLTGTFKGKKRVVMVFVVMLRGQAYFISAIVQGHTDAYKQMAPLVGKAIRGITFPETDEPVRGPLLGMIPDYAWIRGKDAKKEKTITGPGFQFRKPKTLAQVNIRDSMNRDVRFVGEARSADGKAYFYYEIRTFKLNQPNTPNPKEETFVEKRAQDWEAGAGKEAYLGGKKLKFKKSSYGKAKGLSYEFTGHLGDEPVMEEGWVVKHKSTLLWIKHQFIGADAEKLLGRLAKDCKKAVKFGR